MTVPMDSAATVGGVPTVVADDIPCRKCGYNLRALALGGQCPECGTPIGVSVHGELLRYSDPQFVETLRRGVSLILWGVLVIICGMVIAFVVGIGLRTAVQSPALQIVPTIGYVLTVVGAWLLTVPDPSGIGEDR